MRRWMSVLIAGLVVATACGRPGPAVVIVRDQLRLPVGTAATIDVLDNDLLPAGAEVVLVSSPDELEAAASGRSVTVTDVAAEPGFYEVYFEVAIDDRSEPGVLVVEVSAAPPDPVVTPEPGPELIVEPPSIDLGSDPAATTTVEVAVVGSTAALTVPVSVALDADAGLGVDASACPVLDADFRCEISVGVEGWPAEQSVAKLVVAVEGFPHVVVPVRFEPPTAAPDPPTPEPDPPTASFTIDRTTQDFGVVFVGIGGVSSDAFIFENTGEVTLDPTSTSSDPRVASNVAACGAVEPGATCPFVVILDNAEAGAVTADLTIAAEGAEPAIVTVDGDVQFLVPIIPEVTFPPFPIVPFPLLRIWTVPGSPIDLTAAAPSQSVVLHVAESFGGSVAIVPSGEADTSGDVQVDLGSCAAGVETTCEFTLTTRLPGTGGSGTTAFTIEVGSGEFIERHVISVNYEFFNP